MPIIDNAVYVDGHRTQNPESLDETFEVMKERAGMAWIGLYRPKPEEVRAVADEFSLHQLAVDDALAGHQRAKLERYGDTLFVVLRPATYDDDSETVQFGELHVFVGQGFVVTIRHAENPELTIVRQRMEADPALLACGPEAVLYAIMDQVVDEYVPVVAGLEDDIDEIEDQLFGGDPDVSKRIYALLREVTAFQRAVDPMVGMLESLLRGGEKYHSDLEVQRNFRDVLDHVMRLAERLDALHMALQHALTVNATLVTQVQNDEMRRLSELSLAQNEDTKRLSETTLAQTEQTKRISSWAAILFVPSLIGSIYGMNFTFMPELEWLFGYPFALAAMVVSGTGLYLVFKKRRWL